MGKKTKKTVYEVRFLLAVEGERNENDRDFAQEIDTKVAELIDEEIEDKAHLGPAFYDMTGLRVKYYGPDF